MSDILELLAQANPVPAEIPLGEQFAGPERTLPMIEYRRHVMQTISREDRKTRRPNRLIPLVAGLVAVATTVGVVLVVSDEDVPISASSDRQIADVPETPPNVDPVPLAGSSPLEVVETYIDRLNAADLAGAFALYSEEYRTRPWPGVTGSGATPGDVVANWSLYFVALRGQLIHDCTDLEDGRASCTVTAIDDLGRAMSVGDPVYEWEVEVVDGFIHRGLLLPPISATGQPDYQQSDYGAAVAAFDAWARDQYTDQFLESCRNQAVYSTWTVDCARFRIQHVDQFVADHS